ncbi:BlaI/MecI/CopY family transcriptional regulator [Verrucomicrobium sp. GAS474]|uniref:BlaI/MecI/CopY family transcriptional regulator n=1 Tax=Verrucomicrobium sp. GAS474 TaxID=1882831 RepID=UPI000B881695|nr:BlaI/MecI/CopY family transcriptional regulator [Verrucomicrobium sp. GAS474]
MPPRPKKSAPAWEQRLSRRERQVIEILLPLGGATAADIRERLPSAPGYSAVRALLSVMEKKGLLTHEEEGPRYLYRAAMPGDEARQSILRRLLDTLFRGSREELVAALLNEDERQLDPAELDRLSRMIAEAKKKGR